MVKSCKRHDRKTSEGYMRQYPLDPVMVELLENQGGNGRHKCAYCAYERGWNDAVKAMSASLTVASLRFGDSEPDSSDT